MLKLGVVEREEHQRLVGQVNRLIDLISFLSEHTKKLKSENLTLRAENDVLYRKLQSANDRIDKMISRYQDIDS